MNRRLLFVSVVLLALTAASCSAGFSRPRAVSVVEGDEAMYALVDPDPNRNTDTTIPSLLRTSDGRSWEPVIGDRSLPTESASPSTKPASPRSVTKPQGPATASSPRTRASNSSARATPARPGRTCGASPPDVSTSRTDAAGAGRSRSAISSTTPTADWSPWRWPSTGFSTRTVDSEIRLEPLGRPVRPDFRAHGWPVRRATLRGRGRSGHRLDHDRATPIALRHELEIRFGSDEHGWLTDRARQVPDLAPARLLHRHGRCRGRASAG